MAAGINTSKITTLKVDLLDAIEAMNTVLNKLDVEKNIINSNIEGPGKSLMTQRLNSIYKQLGVVTKNINSYINDLSNIEKFYTSQDEELSSLVANDIEKLNLGGSEK